MKLFAEWILFELSVFITCIAVTSAWRTYNLRQICNNTWSFTDGSFEDGATIDVTYGATGQGLKCKTKFTTDPDSRLVLWFEGYTYLSPSPQPWCYRQILLKNIRSDTVDHVVKEFCTSDDVTNEKYFSRSNYFDMYFTAKPEILYATVFRLNIGRYFPRQRSAETSDFKCNNGRYIPSSLHSKACQDINRYDFCTDGTSCLGANSYDTDEASGGSIAGIVVGIVMLVCLGIVCFMCAGKCRSSRAKPPSPPVHERTARAVFTSNQSMQVRTGLAPFTDGHSMHERTARAVFTGRRNLRTEHEPFTDDHSMHERTARAGAVLGRRAMRTARAVFTLQLDSYDVVDTSISREHDDVDGPEDLPISGPPPAYSTIGPVSRIDEESETACSTDNTPAQSQPPNYLDVISNQERYKVTLYM